MLIFLDKPFHYIFMYLVFTHLLCFALLGFLFFYLQYISGLSVSFVCVCECQCSSRVLVVNLFLLLLLFFGCK